jgi:hypothetical protein
MMELELLLRIGLIANNIMIVCSLIVMVIISCKLVR